MEKKNIQNREATLTDAYSLFVYAIRTQITRDYYLRRLRSFFDFIRLLPNAKIENRCNLFAALSPTDLTLLYDLKYLDKSVVLIEDCPRLNF